MLNQSAIFIFGALGIALLGLPDGHRWRRWGYVSGLAGQPFWFAEAWASQQWGIFALCCVYLAAWLLGFYNHFMRAAT